MIVIYNKYVGNGRIESMWISSSNELFITSNKNIVINDKDKSEFECPLSCKYNWLSDCLMELEDLNNELTNGCWQNYLCFRTKTTVISLFICSMIKLKLNKQPLPKPPKP